MNKTLQEVMDFTGANKMFTAHDITKSLRAKNSENIRHDSVRATVNDLYENGDMGIYTRTQINIGNQTPFVYHMPQHDPNDYNKNTSTASTSTTPTNTTPTNGDGTVDVSSVTVIRKVSNVDGRLVVPKSLTGDFNGYQQVHLTQIDILGKQKNALVILLGNTSYPVSRASILGISYNKDGRCRIGNSGLDKIRDNKVNKDFGVIFNIAKLVDGAVVVWS